MKYHLKPAINRDFEGWAIAEKILHAKKTPRSMTDGELWWYAAGENIGAEVCGKGNSFARPILIVRKLNKYSFIGIPISSKSSDNNQYVTFSFHGRVEHALIEQIRLTSVYRLYEKIGEVPTSTLESVRVGVTVLIHGSRIRYGNNKQS